MSFILPWPQIWALCTPPIPIGTALERARTAEDVLAAAARIPAPGPPFALPHLGQDAHQQKRQQLACNALSALSEKVLVGSGAFEERQETLTDRRLQHLARCAAAPSAAIPDGENAGHDRACARLVVTALTALGVLCAADVTERVRHRDGEISRNSELQPLREVVLGLVERADLLTPAMGSSEAVAAWFAARRLLGQVAADASTLEQRVAAEALPFELVPGLCALPPPGSTAVTASIAPALGALVGKALRVDMLQAEIPFAQQQLLTADGQRVRERRHTAWLAEAGIGALAYSGKLMPPTPFEGCDAVVRVRDALQSDTNDAFDCVLCNLYPAGGEAACKWHTDPEHGTKWALPTSVVTAGEPRRFAFRPLSTGGGGGSGGGGGMGCGDERERHTFALVTGDVVRMHGACQQEYEHAVLPGQGARNTGARISLVFKRALLGPDGRRGHGLQGEGRRARARARQQRGSGQHAAAPATSPRERPRSRPKRARSKAR